MNETDRENGMSRPKGTTYFTNPYKMGPQTAMASSFEEVVKALCLSPDQYSHSAELRAWVKRNKNLKFVPLDVLMEFGFTVGG
jgi:hypothetical protein